MKLTLGFSPCPNDTFIFDALVYQANDAGLSFDYVLEDVETLNRMALAGRLDVTKLSFRTYLDVTEEYELLESGSALGKGVGPLLISREPVAPEAAEDWLRTARIAIPGAHTTANLLCSLAYPDARHKTELVFSEIEDAVLEGRADAGLIIHENRFTYQAKGLHQITDLGDWWERTYQAPIPLGGIVIRKSLGAEVRMQVDRLIRQSLEQSWKRYPELSDFVRAHAQEMSEDVMRRHINLYVNEFSLDLGPEGRRAVDGLMRAYRAMK